MPKRTNIYKLLDKEVAEWFKKKYIEPTPPQKQAIPLIARGKHVLITAPTGTGKTFAAFLFIISELIKLNKKNKLEDKVYAVYISPLRALNNDIQRNLLQPLKELGHEEDIRVMIRTGDTHSKERAKQLRKPPHILITTPESLAILLNAPRFREKLKPRWVVVDEIHELADSKRGTHLALSLERLVELAGEFQRIGLSATIAPLDEIAKFLGGYLGDKPREVSIINAMWSKPLDVQVLSPVDSLIETPTEVLNKKLYDMLEELIRSHKTTIIFTNTRSGTERITYNLKLRFGEDADKIEAHHGSMSRETRLEVEEKLKNGQLKAVISSTSLELGIDIGHVDLVVQLGSPKSVSRAMQRIGRSGHTPFSVAKGRVIVYDKDDAVECTVMLKSALEHFLDRITIPKNALDVLAQHIVGMALNRKWSVEEAYELVRRAYPYHELPREDFLSVLYYLAGKYVDLEDRKVYAKIWLEDGYFGRRGKLTRLIYYLNLGTIPDEVKIDVYEMPKKRWVGSIEEEFLERLRRNDIFVLGGKKYRFLYARGMRAYVEPAGEDPPNIPSWFSEMLPLSFDLAEKIREFREEMKKLIAKGYSLEELSDYIFDKYPVNRALAKSIAEYMLLQEQYIGIPEKNEILVEKTWLQGYDEPFYVFHTLYGRRVNDVLSRVFAVLIGKRIRRDVPIAVNDNGFSLRVEKEDFSFDEVIDEFKSVDIEHLLKRYLEGTELVRRRFRHVAARSFLVLRKYKGHKISVRKQQINSQVLFRICKNLKNFPVIKETYREILYDLFDLERAKEIQKAVKSGMIKLRFIETEIPSPFAHGTVILGEPDIVRLEDRREKLKRLYNAIRRVIKIDEVER